MLILPKSVHVEREEGAEDKLVEKTRTWLEKDSNRKDDEIHASDLLDPRKAYWDRKNKTRLSNRAVGLFFTGKVLHAFFLSALGGETGTNWKSDTGSKYHKDLQIYWSNDWEKGIIPYEFKTSRGKYEQKPSDLGGYLEQLLIYMVAKNSTTGRLIVLMLNLPAPRGEGWGTYPQYRAYTVTVSKADLAKYRKQIIKTRKELVDAIKRKKPDNLPLCREFKCGASQCPHYKKCKPPGRYGTRRFDK